MACRECAGHSCCVELRTSVPCYIRNHASVSNHVAYIFLHRHENKARSENHGSLFFCRVMVMSLNIRETWSWPLWLAMTWATIEPTVWASVSHAQRALCQTTRRIRWHVNMEWYSTKLMVVDMAAISAKHGSYQELLMLIRNIRCVMCNVVLNYVCSCEANIAQLARLCQPSAYGAHLKYQTTKRKATKIGVGFFCRFDGVIFTHTVFC